LTVSGGSFNGSTHVDTYTGPALGEAAAIFTGIPGLDIGANFDASGTVSYQEADTPDGDLVLSFDGMDPGKNYSLVFFGHRDDYGWDRAALATLSDVNAFTNESSVATDNPTGTGGTLFDGPSDPSTRLPSDNDNGYVARYTGISPGSDGTMLLAISYDGTGGSNLFKGKYANAIMLEEYDAPPPAVTWTAYNDVVFDATQEGAATDPNGQSVHYIAPNVTTYNIGNNSPGPSSGELIDYATGNPTGVTATLTQSGGVVWQPDISSNWNGGYDTAAGTDAYNTFNGTADMTGVVYYGSTGWYVDLTFTGLDPAAQYTFATSASRANPAYTDRYTI
jgi:hypothetical protein